jgi:P-type E1-E2 ATPase
VHCGDGFTEELLLRYAAAAEQRQSHPVAKAILQAAREHQLPLPNIAEAAYAIGYGISVRVDEHDVHVGSRRYMAQCGFPVPEDIDAATADCHDKGVTLIYIAVDRQLAGVLELHPSVRPEAEQVVAALRRRGLDICIISGDNERPTRALAEQLGIDHYFAETLPEQKADHIARLQAEKRKVCFVGDGINDSIALKKAHVSVSLKGASSVATDTAEVILLDQSLQHLEQLFHLSDDFEKNMRLSLKTSIVPGAVTIAGAFLGKVGFGWAMTLSVGGILAGTANAMAPAFATREPQTSGKGNTPRVRKI